MGAEAQRPRGEVAGLELREREVHVWVVPLDDPDRRRRREVAHVAQARLLAAYLDVAPALLEFERAPGGKPQLRGRELQFNLSHSERLALLAVSRDLPVGVDVQAPHPAVHEPWFPGRICTPREHEHFLHDPRPEELLRLWTRKEALIKARGEGSFLAAGEVDVLDDEAGDGWLCRDLPLSEPRYQAAVALRGSPEVELTVREFRWEG